MRIRPTLRWITLVLIVLVIIYFLCLASFSHDEQIRLGYWGMVSGLIVALLSVLDSIGAFGKKDDESGLAYRADLLTQPLQSIFSNLSNQWELHLGEAINVFVREIQNKALLNVVRKDSVDLPDLLLELMQLEHQISKEEYRERAESPIPFSAEIVEMRMAGLRAKEPRMTELREKIRVEIEKVLAKYSGA